MDNVLVDNPPGAAGGAGGGILWVLAQSVSGAGSVSARGAAGGGDPPEVECTLGYEVSSCFDHSGAGGGGAGGSVRLDVARLSGVTLDVSGGAGGNGADQAGGNGGDGGRGALWR
jgi:hypothetical protein